MCEVEQMSSKRTKAYVGMLLFVLDLMIPFTNCVCLTNRSMRIIYSCSVINAELW